MFHNVLMTSLAPMRDTNEIRCWENRPLTTIWPETNQEKLKDTTIKKTIKKKKRNRTMFTTEQVKILEKVFARSRYIDVERRREISECLQIGQKCIKIWFQNRRMKEKKELSESCDSTSESQASSLEPMSSTIEPTQSSSNEPNTGYNYSQEHDHMKSQYYYDAPNNYLETEVRQNEQNIYRTSDSPTIPEYLSYHNNNFHSVLKNNTNYSAQYCPAQTEFQYYYNNGEVNNQYITNIRDWPANIYDTSYF